MYQSAAQQSGENAGDQASAAAAGGEGPSAGPGGEEVVDADFEVIDDEKK